jgi:glycosyltransferase involved in cell wall biosynthesis
LGIGRVVGWTIRQIAPRSGDSVYAFEEFVRASKIDVVWFLPPHHDLVSVPYICTPYDLQHRVQPCFPEVSNDWKERERSYATILPRAARIITGTQTGKSEIVALYGVHPDNVVVVPMPTPVPDIRFEGDVCADIRNKYGITSEFVLYPAQFWPHKNHVNLLLALDQIRRDTGLKLDLVLTGGDKGNLDHVREVIASLGLGAQVHILGFVPRAELDKLYRAAVALTYPSFFGPDNLPPLEAFARNAQWRLREWPVPKSNSKTQRCFSTPPIPRILRGQSSPCITITNCAPSSSAAAWGWSPLDLPRRTLRGYARSWATLPASGGAGVRTTWKYERGRIGRRLPAANPNFSGCAH